MKLLSRDRLFVTPWTVANQAPSMRFSRQEYWSELPFPSPEDLPDSGIKPMSLISLALAGGFFTTSTTWEALYLHYPLTNLIKETFVKKKKMKYLYSILEFLPMRNSQSYRGDRVPNLVRLPQIGPRSKLHTE